MILAILGSQSLDSLSFITDQKALEYVLGFPERPRIPFQQLYPASSPQAIDFLNRCIVFNPKDRISLDEALEHPYFSKVRNKAKETSIEPF